MDIGNLNSYYNNIYTNAQNSASSKLENSLDGDFSNATDEELMDVCRQFESYFVEQMYKEMYKTIPQSEESTGANATMIDYFKDQMIQSIASDTSKQGNLGLAQMLYEQMKRNVGIDPSQIDKTSKEEAAEINAETSIKE